MRRRVAILRLRVDRWLRGESGNSGIILAAMLDVACPVDDCTHSFFTTAIVARHLRVDHGMVECLPCHTFFSGPDNLEEHSLLKHV